MDVSGANSDDHVGKRSLDTEELVDDFVSFTDDLVKAGAVSVGADMASFSKQDVDHSGEGNLQENFFANSVVVLLQWLQKIFMQHVLLNRICRQFLQTLQAVAVVVLSTLTLS